MPGIGIISNPFSRRNRKNPEILTQLKNLVPDKSLAMFPTSFEEMDIALDGFKEKNIDILGINGGDGTLHVTLTHLIKVYKDHPLPMIAPLKGGTMNMVATDIRIKGSPVSILKRISEKYTAGSSFKTAKRRLIKIGDNYGFIFGNGVVCNFMDIYHKGGNPSPFVAFKSLMIAVKSIVLQDALYRKLFETFNAEIIADNFSFGYKPYIAAFISTLNEIGLGFRFLHRNEDHPDCMHMMGLLDENKLRIVSQLGRVWMGRSMPPTMADDTSAKQIYIKADRPFKYTLDGDFYNSNGHLLLQADRFLEMIVE